MRRSGRYVPEDLRQAGSALSVSDLAPLPALNIRAVGEARSSGSMASVTAIIAATFVPKSRMSSKAIMVALIVYMIRERHFFAYGGGEMAALFTSRSSRPCSVYAVRRRRDQTRFSHVERSR